MGAIQPKEGQGRGNLFDDLLSIGLVLSLHPSPEICCGANLPRVPPCIPVFRPVRSNACPILWSLCLLNHQSLDVIGEFALRLRLRLAGLLG